MARATRRSGAVPAGARCLSFAVVNAQLSAAYVMRGVFASRHGSSAADRALKR